VERKKTLGEGEGYLNINAEQREYLKTSSGMLKEGFRRRCLRGQRVFTQKTKEERRNLGASHRREKESKGAEKSGKKRRLTYFLGTRQLFTGKLQCARRDKAAEQSAVEWGVIRTRGEQ